MRSETLPAGHRFRVGFGFPAGGDGQHIALPFRRSVPVILVAAVVALVMTVPAVDTFADAAQQWRGLESLFDLTSALFLSAWLLGWSTGLLIVYAVLAVVVTGREALVLRPGVIEIRFGLPFLYMKTQLDPAAIDKLRHRVPKSEHGTSWRGPHLEFEYRGVPLQLGSNISPARAEELARMIRAVPAGSGNAARQPRPARRPDTAAASPANREQTGPGSLATLALLAANLVPVVGVLLLGWDLGTLMVLFWAESAIIGLYNLCKMAVVQRWAVLITGPFFLGHFGGFMAIHFLFVYELFVGRGSGTDSSLAAVGQFLITLWPALLALLISHGLSFFINFLGRQEYRDRSAKQQMQEPYSRIVIMHLTVIFGGGLALALGSPMPALLLLVALKVATDLHAHWKQRRGRAAPAR